MPCPEPIRPAAWRARVLGARFLQPRLGFLPVDFQTDAFFDHLDLALEHVFSGGKPRRRLIQRRAPRGCIRAVDREEWCACLDHFSRAHQHRGNPARHRRANRELRLRAKRDAGRQYKYVASLRGTRGFYGEELLLRRGHLD